MRRRLGAPETIAAGIVAAAVALAIVPAAASAADTFVDATQPDDTEDCLSAATACETIGAAATKAGAGDTVFVVDPAAQTTYAENVALPDGRGLVALSPDPAETIVDGPSAVNPAVLLTGDGGVLDGFTVRSDFLSLRVQGVAMVQENVFDEGTPPTGGFIGADVQLDSLAGGSVVTENEFSDPSPTAGQTQTGIVLFATATVSDNSFDDLVVGIFSGGSAANASTISGNDISGTRQGGGAGAAISVMNGTPTISDNRIDQPFFAAPADTITGIGLNGDPGAVGATLRRNVILGHRFGVSVEDTPGPVTLEGDLIVSSVAAGLRLVDFGGDDAGVSDVTATNVTIANTDDPTVVFEAEVSASSANLTLDSSLVDDKGISTFGSAGCTLSFSRGPTTSGGSCQTFQTNADPLFNDFHLTEPSGLIDAGNPAPPAAALDIDGQPRLVMGRPACAARRDIGADEFAPASPVTPLDCLAPDTTINGKKKVKTRKKRARVLFTLGSAEPGPTFECSVDGAAFAPCSTPFSVRLRRGRHSIQARARDASGNRDETPAAFTVKVKPKRTKR